MKKYIIERLNFMIKKKDCRRNWIILSNKSQQKLRETKSKLSWTFNWINLKLLLKINKNNKSPTRNSKINM